MSAANYEGAGHDAVGECLDAILNSSDQGSSCRHLLELLNSLSGDGEIANAARRGAAVALVNVLERGLESIKSDVSRINAGLAISG
jgi:hypothetical protein